MGFRDFAAGKIRIRITSTSVARIISKANDAGITFSHLDWIDDLSVETTVKSSWYSDLIKIAERTGGQIEIRERIGVFWRICAFRRRPILLLSLALYLAVALFVPTRIFFVKVVGNTTVSEETILTEAEKAGVSFGVCKKDIRSEKIKNVLLSSFDALQWAGVNTYGCVAEISVRERIGGDDVTAQEGIRSIVAKCDALVREMTVTKGNGLCKVGDVVKKGQVLISGYTDCGIQIKATAAEGEVYGETTHIIHAISPLIRHKRGTEAGENKKYSLLIGKKLIKLYNGSGISDTGCVKMYEKKYLTLPGGFELPLAILVETQICHDSKTVSLTEEQFGEMTTLHTRNLLLQDMVAGRILSEKVQMHADEDVLHFHGRYYCYEMIGKLFYEEIIDGNDQTDGTDHKR